MKSLRMSLHFDDRITYGDMNHAFGKKERFLQGSLRSCKDIEKHYPNVVCKFDCPSPVKFSSVPFKLKNDTPMSRKPYALSRNKQDFVRKELERLKANGIIRNSESPFASPVLLVAKPNGTWRMCTDYRAINDYSA